MRNYQCIVPLFMLLFVASSAFAQSGTDQEETGKSPASHVLSLDAGKRWKANPETTTGVQNMIKYMESFTPKDEVQAYLKLKEQLQEEMGGIFQACNMTGEAHEQLHAFLVPIFEYFEGLESTDLNTCQNSYKQLKEHLKLYAKFFK